MEPDRSWLEAGGVEVWLTTPEPEREAAAAALLNEAERERAAHFIVDEGRRRFVAGRGLVRWVLGRLLALEPGAVPLLELPSGKPAVAATGARFNVAHSGSLVLAALAWEREVGVDVEVLRPRDELRVARRYFRPAETAALEAVQGGERTRLFARCWTRKEALLKAYGASALLVGLSSLERPFALEHTQQGYAHAGRTWTVGDVPLPVTDHVAAVAVEGNALRLRVQWWQP